MPLFAVICRDKPGALQVRLDTRGAHPEPPYPGRRRSCGDGPGLIGGGRADVRIAGRPGRRRRRTPLAGYWAAADPCDGGGAVRLGRRDRLEQGHRLIAHWLFKSEPDVFGWDDLVAAGRRGRGMGRGAQLPGAQRRSRAMQVRPNWACSIIPDIGKEAVGDRRGDRPGASRHHRVRRAKWECVRHPRGAQAAAISLDEAKAEPRLRDMVLVNNSRLSVQPVSDADWAVILELAGDRG